MTIDEAGSEVLVCCLLADRHTGCSQHDCPITFTSEGPPQNKKHGHALSRWCFQYEVVEDDDEVIAAQQR